jgi:protein-tyrosine phosphatase
MTGEWAPSRQVALDGAVNVRDIGGYRSAHGLEVARGRLFRGDSLSQLTSADTERLDRLGLRTVIDFRTPGEVLLGGDDRLPYGVELAHLPVSGGDLGALYELIASGDHERQRRELGGGRAASYIAEMNRGFVTDARQREAFGAALRLVCSPGRLPLLYHCTGGKDRAGWMTAIVLTALGVPRELVLRDYLLSNDFHRTGYQKLRMDLVKTGIVADLELLRPDPRAERHLPGRRVRGGGPELRIVRPVPDPWPRGQRGHAGRISASAARRPGTAGTRLVSSCPASSVLLAPLRSPGGVSPCDGAGRGGACGAR